MDEYVKVEEALEELGLDQEDFTEFVGDLKEFMEEALPQLEEAVGAKDFPQIRAHAHAIKGALANLRFVHTSAIAFALEKQGLNSDDSNLDENLASLRDSLSKSYAELG